MIEIQGKIIKNSVQAKAIRSSWYTSVAYFDCDLDSPIRFGNMCENIRTQMDKGIFCIHDSDTTVDENGVITPKKKHVHFVFKHKSNPNWCKVADLLGVEWNYIQPVVNERLAIRYLIHIDNPDKFQYDISDIQQVGAGTKKIDIQSYFRDDANYYCDLKNIIDAIHTSEEITSMTTLVLWCINNNALETLQKYQYLLNLVLRERYEHN